MRQDRNTRQDTTTNQEHKVKSNKDKRKAITGCCATGAGIVLTILARSVEGLAQWYSTCVSCLGKYAGAAYGNVPIFSGGDPAVSLFTGTDALGREADSPAGELGAGEGRKVRMVRRKKSRQESNWCMDGFQGCCWRREFYIFCMWPAAGSITTGPPFRKAQGSWRRNIRSGSLQSLPVADG